METVQVTVILKDRWPLYRIEEDVYLANTYVPRGFISNGASVPRIFWSLYPPVGRYFLAAVVHDYVLAEGMKWKDATKIFDDALRELGISSKKRWVMVNAVAFYGLVRRKP